MKAKLGTTFIRRASPFTAPYVGKLARSYSTADPRVSRMGLEPVFSSGEDPAQLQTSLKPLIQAGSGKWTLTGDGQGLERSLKFKTFKAAWQFMNTVAEECKSHRHHPEWSNVYNSVFVRWTTHNPEGLSRKDITMATICDEVATRGESLAIEDTESDSTRLKDVADEAARNAADCCKK